MRLTGFIRTTGMRGGHGYVLRSLRTRVRARLCVTARDITEATARRPALVLAAHPDDETLGCGGTILHKVASGASVTILVVSDGRYSHRNSHLPPQDLARIRRGEMAEAARRLGLGAEALRWGGFIDGTLATAEGELTELIADALAEERPEEVYVTGAFEPHPDHAALGRAARRAVRHAATHVQLLEYPIWLWAQWPLPGRDRLTAMLAAAKVLSLKAHAAKVRVVEHLAAKQHALDAHASQLRRPAGVPADEPWWTMPPVFHGVAGDGVELFLPWKPSERRGRRNAESPARRAVA